jgi:copper chaperone CopZ
MRAERHVAPFKEVAMTSPIKRAAPLGGAVLALLLCSWTLALGDGEQWTAKLRGLDVNNRQMVHDALVACDHVTGVEVDVATGAATLTAKEGATLTIDAVTKALKGVEGVTLLSLEKKPIVPAKSAYKVGLEGMSDDKIAKDVETALALLQNVSNVKIDLPGKAATFEVLEPPAMTQATVEKALVLTKVKVTSFEKVQPAPPKKP